MDQDLKYLKKLSAILIFCRFLFSLKCSIPKYECYFTLSQSSTIIQAFPANLTYCDNPIDTTQHWSCIFFYACRLIPGLYVLSLHTPRWAQFKCVLEFDYSVVWIYFHMSLLILLIDFRNLNHFKNIPCFNPNFQNNLDPFQCQLLHIEVMNILLWMFATWW